MSTGTQKAIEAIERELGHMQSRHDDSVGAIREQLAVRMDSLREALAALRTEQPKRPITMEDVRLGCGEIGREAAIVAEWILKRWQPTMEQPNVKAMERVLTDEEMEEASHKWANEEPPWPGPVERTYARTVFKDGLRYARDNGYLAPQASETVLNTSKQKRHPEGWRFC